MNKTEKMIKGVKNCFEKKDCDGCPYDKELREIMDKDTDYEWHCPIMDDLLEVLEEKR